MPILIYNDEVRGNELSYFSDAVALLSSTTHLTGPFVIEAVPLWCLSLVRFRNVLSRRIRTI